MNNTIKRLLGVILTCLFVFSSCTGTKISDGQEELLNKNDPVVIEIWTYYNSRAQEVLDRYIKLFNETEGAARGIIVRQVAYGEISLLTEALVQASRSGGMSGKMPDLFVTYKGIAGALNVSDALIDFKEYMTEEELSEYADIFIKSGSLPENPEKLQMFSIDRASEVLFLNATLIERYVSSGLLRYEDFRTYEELSAAAERYYRYTDALTEEPHDGKALFGANSLANIVWLGMAEMGHEILRMEAGQEVVSLDRESFKKYFDYIFLPYVMGYFDNHAKFVSEDIRAGELLIGQSSTSGTPFFPKETVIGDEVTPIEAKVMPLPHFKGVTPYVLIQGGGVFGYRHSDKSAAASVVFLKWLTNEENALDFALKKSYMPALKSVFNAKNIKASLREGKIDVLTSDTYQMLIELFEQRNVYEPFPTAHYEEIRRRLGEYLNTTWRDARAEYRSRLASGMTEEDAAAKFVDGAFFDLWFMGIEDAVREVLEK